MKLASTEKVTKLSAEIAALKEKNKALESKIRDLEESKAQVVEELRQIKVEAGDAQQRIYDLALATVARPTHELPATSTKRSSRSVLPDTHPTQITHTNSHTNMIVVFELQKFKVILRATHIPRAHQEDRKDPDWVLQ